MASTNPIPNCVQTITIPAGGSMVIPAGAKIISVDGVDPTSLNASCPDLEDQLQNAEAMQCYEFAIEGGQDHGSEGDSWDVDGVNILALEIGTQVYEIGIGLRDFKTLPSVLRSVTGGLMKLASVDANAHEAAEHNNRIRFTLVFKMAPSLAAVARLKMENARDNESGLAFPVYYAYARTKTITSLECP